jgi:drug/metabolite transporter (DMT)-like permease
MRVRWNRTDFLVLCVVLIWAATFSVVKSGLRELGPLSFATLRFTVAAGLMLAWVWILEGTPAIRREDWLRVAVVGLTVIGVYQALFTVGLQYTTASNSSLMLASIPAWTVLFAGISRQERFSALQIVGILMSFVGVAMAIRGAHGQFALSWESVRGDALTLVAAALYGIGAVVSKPLLLRYSSLRVMTMAIVFGSIFLVVVSVPELAAQHWDNVSLATWLGVAYASLFGAVFAFVIWFKSIGEIGASRTSIYNNLIPPVAMLIAFGTLGERFSPLQLLGAGIVLAGVTLTRFAQPKGEEVGQQVV